MDGVLGAAVAAVMRRRDGETVRQAASRRWWSVDKAVVVVDRRRLPGAHPARALPTTVRANGKRLFSGTQTHHQTKA